MYSTIDLHSHSTESDGQFSPTAVVARAAENGVTHLALTDHDTVTGIDEALQAAMSHGLEVIPGVELSSQWNGRSVHIVGLNIDPEHPALTEALSALGRERDQRAEKIAERLEKLGFHGALEGAKRFAGGAVVARPHFARFLVDAGYVKSIQKAFAKYLGKGKAGDIKPAWPSMADAIHCVKKSGGIAVLAHPLSYDLTRTKLKSLISDFSDAGGEAIEVVSGDQSRQEIESLAMLAQEFHLKGSCGSDFHVDNAPWQELGRTPPLPSQCIPVWGDWAWPL
ncbi:phosphatase [Marinibactrum halimedae]|uniref:Phosphatase n=1 Tax=Marinibactrum halimedae TaxID=1444977 RepID=A0AA37T6W4_9GAMM|nr:phosphatase [Marinibactrum halimedae]